MKFDTSEIPVQMTYKLMTATITPRPIAWVTTRALDGTVNAAPYSFFNGMGQNPPTLAVGIQRDPARGVKDTGQNILDTGEFVVNLVPRALAEAMNVTSMSAPAGVDELAAAGLKGEASAKVAAPRIKGSPVQFECALISGVVTGPQQMVAIGRIEVIHVADEFVTDADRAHIDNEALDLIARLHGSGWYLAGGERFQMTRPVYEGDGK